MNAGGHGIILSGEVHYSRLNPDLWSRVLDRVRELGFHQVSTYVPWSGHETAPGSYDFSGPLDVVRFCSLAAERDLGVLVRPGPDTGSEQETSGWPRWVLDDPRCQARRPTGRPYLLLTATHHAFMPSYASQATLDAISRWYDEVIPRLAPLQAPDGPVVACQVDNEMGYHFQPHPYVMDYHPDAIEAWRGWLVERYGGLGGLNAAYGTRWTGPGDIDPPRDGTDDPELRRVDWVEWKEVHLRQSIATLGRLMRERGMDRVPLVHNDYPRTDSPQDIGALERSGAIDVATADVYTTKEGGRFARDLVRYLAGSTRTPSLGEVGAGWLTLPWLLPMDITPQDEEHVTMRVLAAGAREMNIYMLVERDRWYGSPVGADGSLRLPRASLYPKLRRLIDDLDWGSLRRKASVLLLENRTERRRIAARQILGEAVPCFSQLLPIDRRLTEPHDPDAHESERWQTQLAGILDEAGVDHNRASTSALPDLDPYDVVLVPTLDAFDPAAWERLRRAAEAGTTVGFGPRIPSLDTRLAAAEFVHGAMIHLACPTEATPLLPGPGFTIDRAACDLHHFTGGREVLVGVNATGEPAAGTLSFSGRVRLEPRWSDSETLDGDASVRVVLPAWGIEVWEVFR